MKVRVSILLAAALVFPAARAHAQSDQQATQVKLDAACEAAREQRLAPEREQYINECVSTKFKASPEECRRFYSDYGAQTDSRPALYYDLPECVKAFEFRQNTQLK